MKKFSLKKIIVISFLLSISFIIEFIITKTIFGDNCQISLFKLELLPLVLIGFLFGFRYSFFSNLLYILIHIVLESVNSFHQHSLLKEEYPQDKQLLMISIVLLFIFIIPYLSCSLTGLFYSRNQKSLCKKKNILNSLLLITIIQIISYFFFVCIFYDTEHIASDITIIKRQIDSPRMFVFLYFSFSVIITNIVIGFCIYLIKNIYPENENIYFID